jgi:hypothetical protein
MNKYHQMPLTEVWDLIRPESEKQFWLKFEMLGYEFQGLAEDAIKQMDYKDYSTCIGAMVDKADSLFEEWKLEDHPELQFSECSEKMADRPF